MSIKTPTTRNNISIAIALVALCAGLFGSLKFIEHRNEQKAMQTLLQTAKSNSDAYLAGDVKAVYSTYSKRCQQHPDYSPAQVQANTDYAKAHPWEVFQRDATGSTHAAKTVTRTSIGILERRWVNENGSWKWDNC